MNLLEQYYANLNEPYQSAFLFFRQLILSIHPEIKEDYKWSGGFFDYRNRMLCYFWIDKKTKQPYISFGEGQDMSHPQLKSLGRKRFKLYFFDPNKTLNTKLVRQFVEESIVLINNKIDD